MQLMVEGDKWEMYIPSDLGYGDRGSPPKIGGGDTLIFQVRALVAVRSILNYTDSLVRFCHRWRSSR